MTDEFDKSVNDAFYGTGKPITTEAMLFQQTFNRVAKDTPFSCPIAWQEENKIVANIRKQETGSSVEGLYQCDVSSDYEVKARGMIADFDTVRLSIPAAKPSAAAIEYMKTKGAK
jgi:hypothetical protein